MNLKSGYAMQEVCEKLQMEPISKKQALSLSILLPAIEMECALYGTKWKLLSCKNRRIKYERKNHFTSDNSKNEGLSSTDIVWADRFI